VNGRNDEELPAKLLCIIAATSPRFRLLLSLELLDGRRVRGGKGDWCHSSTRAEMRRVVDYAEIRFVGVLLFVS
jgi:hypothetical protein